MATILTCSLMIRLSVPTETEMDMVTTAADQTVTGSQMTLPSGSTLIVTALETIQQVMMLIYVLKYMARWTLTPTAVAPIQTRTGLPTTSMHSQTTRSRQLIVTEMDSRTMPWLQSEMIVRMNGGTVPKAVGTDVLIQTVTVGRTAKMISEPTRLNGRTPIPTDTETTGVTPLGTVLAAQIGRECSEKMR